MEQTAGPVEAGPPAEPAAPLTDEKARAVFRAGREASEAEDLAVALRLFEAARVAPGIDPDHVPWIVWSIATTQARLGDFDAATRSAQTYRQIGVDPPAEELNAFIASLQDRPGPPTRGQGQAAARAFEPGA